MEHRHIPEAHKWYLICCTTLPIRFKGRWGLTEFIQRQIEFHLGRTLYRNNLIPGIPANSANSENEIELKPCHFSLAAFYSGENNKLFRIIYKFNIDRPIPTNKLNKLDGKISMGSIYKKMSLFGFRWIQDCRDPKNLSQILCQSRLRILHRSLIC